MSSAPGVWVFESSPRELQALPLPKRAARVLSSAHPSALAHAAAQEPLDSVTDLPSNYATVCGLRPKRNLRFVVEAPGSGDRSWGDGRGSVGTACVFRGAADACGLCGADVAHQRTRHTACSA